MAAPISTKRPGLAAPAAPKATKQPYKLKAPAFKSTAPGKPVPERASTGPAGGPQTFDKSKAAQGKAAAIAAAKGHAAAAVGATTDWLAPQTPAALAKQAAKTIGAAYKPSFGDLNSEQKQLAAINAKRAQDNTAYEQWASGQEQSILAQGSASDANFSAAVASANSALAGAAPSSAALVASANDRAGNVSDNSTSTQLGAGGTVDQNTANVNGTNDIHTAADLGSVENGGDLLRADTINANSRIGDNEASQAATAQQQMTAIGTQRSKLQLSKAGDIEKEIARLQGVEIQKAQNTQQLTAAEQKLGLTAQQDAIVNGQNAAKIQNTAASIVERAKATNATLAERTAEANLRAQTGLSEAGIRARTSMSETELREAEIDKTFQLNQKKYGLAKAAQLWKEQHPAAAGGVSASGLTFNEQQEQYNDIDKTRGVINGLLATHNKPGGDTAVYQALANGTPIQVGISSTGKPVMKTYPPVATAILNAAFDLSNGRHGLTPKDIAKLKAIGLKTPGAHYRTTG